MAVGALLGLIYATTGRRGHSQLLPSVGWIALGVAVDLREHVVTAAVTSWTQAQVVVSISVRAAIR